MRKASQTTIIQNVVKHLPSTPTRYSRNTSLTITVAQLVNYIEKTVILNQGIDSNKQLEVDDLALEMREYSNDSSTINNLDLSLKDARAEFEKEYLLSQIKRFSGNMSKISEFTGMERTALYRKIKSLKISLN